MLDIKYHIVTTLISSSDRIENIQKEFKKFKINPNFYWSYNSKIINKIDVDFSKLNKISHDRTYIPNNTGWIGCETGLLGAINIAKILNWPYLFVFEDDITIHPKFNELMNQYVAENLNYSMILLGYNQSIKNTKNNYLFTFNDMYISGGYGYLINQNYYDFFIDKINNPDCIQVRDQIYFKYFSLDKSIDNVYLLSNKLIMLNELNEKSNIE